jgi:hypothetical protein
MMRDVPMGGEITVLKESNGQNKILKQSIVKKYDLKIYNVPQWVAVQLALSLVLDKIKINNTAVTAAEPPKIEPILNSNFQNISVLVEATNWDYGVEYSQLQFVNTIAINNNSFYGTNNNGTVATSNN